MADYFYSLEMCIDWDTFQEFRKDYISIPNACEQALLILDNIANEENQ